MRVAFALVLLQGLLLATPALTTPNVEETVVGSSESVQTENAEDTAAVQEIQEIKDEEDQKPEDPDLEIARKRPAPWDQSDNQVYQYRSPPPPSDVYPYQGPGYMHPGPPQFCCPHPVQCHYPQQFGPPPPEPYFLLPPPQEYHPMHYGVPENDFNRNLPAHDFARDVQDAGAITVDRTTTAKRRAPNATRLPKTKPTKY